MCIATPPILIKAAMLIWYRQCAKLQALIILCVWCNRRVSTVRPSVKHQCAAIETTTRKNDTLVITEYNPIAYNLVRGQRLAFSYDFKYRIINAYTNQIIDQRTNTVRSMDAIEFQEFITRCAGSINSLFPYNPQQTALPLARYNPVRLAQPV